MVRSYGACQSADFSMLTLETCQKQLTQASDELTDCQENYEALCKRLNEAESILSFYSNPVNYRVEKSSAIGSFQSSLALDCEHISGNTFVGGKRAREYFKRYQTVSDSGL